MKKCDFSIKHCEHYTEFKSGDYVSFIYAENRYFGICGEFSLNKICMDFSDEFPMFWTVIEEIKSKIISKEACNNLEKSLFDGEITLKFNFDGNKDMVFDFAIWKRSGTNHILCCMNYTDYDILMCKILSVFEFGFMPNPSRKLLVSALIMKISSQVKNVDEMIEELHKLSDLRNICNIADSKIVASIKVFLFNNSKNVKMVARMKSQVGDLRYHKGKSSRKKIKITINEIIDNEIKELS